MKRFITKIQTKAGWCCECSRWRYCDHECESKLICINCLTRLSNQNLVEFVKPEPEPKPEPKPKPKPEPKPKVNLQKDSTLTARILGFLLANKSAFCVHDIAERFNTDHSTAWRILGKLVKSKDVIATDKKRNRIYVHASHEVNIEKYESLIRGRSIVQVREILHSNNTRWFSSLEMTQELFKVSGEIRKQQTILDHLRFLVSEGEAISYWDGISACNKFGSISNEEDLCNQKIENTILSLLKTGRKSRQAIAQEIGLNKRSIKGITAIILNLEFQGKVKILDIGGTQYVKLI